MRITESRLRRVIRQVIKEIASPSLESEMMELGVGLYPGPDGDEGAFQFHCQEIDSMNGFESGTVYNAVHDACEDFSPGSRDSDVLVIQCLNSDLRPQVIRRAIQLLP
tara:strand:+ start:63397 stop:63720 length:324 start_codon:yes stop_codon:yes gene_type:complete